MTRLRTVGTARGPRLEVSHVFEGNPDAAWDALVDTRRWPDWNPWVTDVEASDRRLREGTTGRIRTRRGVWLPFTVTEYADRKRRWRWNVARLPTADHRVSDLGNGRCRVAFVLSPVAIGAAPAVLEALEALEEHVRDGPAIPD